MMTFRGALLLVGFSRCEASPFSDWLGTLKGKSGLDCADACSKHGGDYAGYSMRMWSDESEYTCTCGAAKVKIICEGSPFRKCCQDSCKAPPADEPFADAGPGGSDSLDGAVSNQNGKNSVDCSGMCTAAEGEYRGSSSGWSGGITTTTCKCGPAGNVVVQCLQRDHIVSLSKCCVGEACLEKEGSLPAGVNQCPSSEGWSCPASGGCSADECGGEDWQKWVAAHNVYRCMHDAPPVTWSTDMFENVKDHFQGATAMKHSDCYKVPAPAGPAGENLYQGPVDSGEMDVVKMWYSEIELCDGNFPGCDVSNTGHFTALIWQGVREIGCTRSGGGIVACRYKGLDTLGCQTPNMQGNYEKNVFKRTNSYESCVAKVQACGFDVPSTGFDGVTGLNEKLPVLGLPRHGEICAVVLAAVFAVSLAMRRRMKADRGLVSQTEELLQA